ncbi:MAG: bifunctional DNA-formamidopyrimidine glycosylase/DNA-(apurinic or apyrimidinic site) lyase [Acidobacteria bacterium]|nr:bifunctional DNA-formamidopyrimidine glycosylase/DNA-(apurinic or apyrimidinic site) lyase [Acidobacteriota bacterium]
MPELPEVEAVCRRLRAEAIGAGIVQLRVERPRTTWPQRPSWVERQVAGSILERVERRGKHIVLRLSGDRAIRVHLRMTGKLYVIPDVRFRPPATRAWMELSGGRGLIFEDSRALGKLHVYRGRELDQALEDLGIEPLSKEFTAGWLVAAASRSRQPAKLFLMDQRRVAGLGNIYAAEALFRAGIHPARPVNRIRRSRIEALHRVIRSLLEEAVASAVLAYSEPGAVGEAESFPCAVYGREGAPCERCSRKIRRIRQGGRSTYFCPGCQRSSSHSG